MVKIAMSQSTTLEMLEAPTHVGELRPYLGMSALGHECNRYLWFNFRWAVQEEITDRQRRLFQRGHDEEEKVIENLKRIGIDVYGEQDEFISGFGHMKGHCDGKCINVPEAKKTEHLLEIKTMNDRNFKEVIKRGVKVSKPIYYGQCQIGMCKFNLTRTLFVAVNKNDDSYYVERIYYNKAHAEMLEQRGLNIILSERPDVKLYKSTWYMCKFCQYSQVCHHGMLMRKSCRTCTYGGPGQNGSWDCSNNYVIDKELMINGCNDYRQIELI